METQECIVCGNEKIKKGKITGIAALQSLKSRSGLSSSELVFTLLFRMWRGSWD